MNWTALRVVGRVVIVIVSTLVLVSGAALSACRHVRHDGPARTCAPGESGPGCRPLE